MVLLANFISRLCEPALLLAIVFFVGELRLGLSVEHALAWLGVLFLPTHVYRLWAKRREHLDWDIQDRHRRTKPLLKLLIFLTLTTIFVWMFEARLMPLFSIVLVWAIGFFILTVSWTKISGHAAAAALTTGLIVWWFGSNWWPILFLPLVVGWARIVTKNHTLVQVIAGTVYSWGLLIAFSV